MVTISLLFADLPEEIDVKPAKTDVNPNSETQCYYCGQMFIISTIKDHMINTHGSYFGRQHGPPRPLQCQNCNVSTTYYAISPYFENLVL